MEDTQLSCALDQRRLRLPDSREGLIEIGRHLAKFFALQGQGLQPQGDASLIHVGQDLNQLCARGHQGRLPVIELRPRNIVRRHQLPCPLEFELGQCQRRLALVDAGNSGAQFGDLIGHVLHGVLQFPASAHGLRFNAADHGGRRLQVRLCRIDGRPFYCDCGLIRLLVQFDKKVSPAHAVIVVHEDTRNLTADARGNEGDVTVHERVVGRNGVESLQDPRNANHKDGCQNHSARCSKQHFSPPRGLLLLW